MDRTAAVDGFRLAYERTGAGPAVVLLHGWPSDRTEYRDVVPLLPAADVVVPDLRGFGASDKHPADPTVQYNADAQARSVIALIEEVELDRPVLGGHDIGSRVAQAVARHRPDLVRALVLTPPLPGIGERILTPSAQQEFWYLPFHQLPLADELIDGRPDAVRCYLRHFWTHWSGPGFTITEDHLDHLVALYAEPGAFTASLFYHRVGSGGLARVLAEPVPQPAERITTPTTVLWPEHDPLFPTGWSDRLGQFFADVRLHHVDGGHFIPLECPREFAAAVTTAAATTPSAEPVVRDAEHDDVAAICRFGEAYIRPHYAPLIGAEAADEQVRRWWNETHVGAAVAEGLVVVAEADGQLVGVGQRGRRGADHVVYKLYVHPWHRGRGLGPRLLDALTGQLPAHVGRLYIEHFVANERAGAFYEREGFTVERVEASPTEDPALGVVWRARRRAPSEQRSGQA